MYETNRVETKGASPASKDQGSESKETIYDAVTNLKHFPDCPNIKKLKNRNDYRLRVGNWRVLFTDSLMVLTIEEVKRRNEQTY